MQKSFTLIEILTVFAVTLILISLSVVSLSTVRESASTDSALEVLLSDIKLQQTKSMTGDTFGQTTTLPFGIYFTSTSYTLFRGNSYSVSDPLNFTVPLSGNLQFSSITFPSSQIVFEKGSGEIVNFNAATDTVTLRNTVSNDDTVITLNKYGVFTSVQ
jgi:type II secretory pathway pseudopilin PulG